MADPITITETTTTLLPRVYTLGFRSGQAVYHFWNSLSQYNQLLDAILPSAIVDSSSNDPTNTASSIWSMITSFPLWYRTWWMDLLRNDPVHVFVETTLLLSVLYMFLTRTKDWGEHSSKNKDKLTQQEEDDLILEWREKGRKPLVDVTTTDSVTKKLVTAKDVPQFVVHNMDGTHMVVTMDEEPTLYPVINFGTFDFLGMSAEFTAKDPSTKTTQHVGITTDVTGVDENENKENTVSNSDSQDANDNLMVIDDVTDNNADNNNNNNNNPASPTVGDSDDEPVTGSSNNVKNTNAKKKRKKKKKKASNEEDDAGPALASTDNKSKASKTTINKENMNPVKRASVDALERYGCGACGPRGFYGTVDVHLTLEEEMTKYMGAEGGILYSDGASAVSSTVAAFCKRGDLLVVDEGVREPVVSGVKLSRAYVKWFKHNDMDDLRRVLESVAENDKKLKRAPNAQRRFIICEGLYKNTGLIAPLDKIVAMKHEFHYRLILDESYSFGTLGPTGKGALELFNKRIMYDAEIVTIALENALGSVGGVTLGNEEIVDHQRLSGSGYCFSAASPPFTASAAIESLHQIQARSKELLSKLNENKQYLYDKLRAFSELQEDLILISSDIRSPIVFLVLAECEETEDIDETVFLSEIVRECIRRGIGILSAGQHNTRAGVQLLRAEPQPSIRLSVSAAHTKQDIDFAVQVLSESLSVVMKRYVDGEI